MAKTKKLWVLFSIPIEVNARLRNQNNLRLAAADELRKEVADTSPKDIASAWIDRLLEWDEAKEYFERLYPPVTMDSK